MIDLHTHSTASDGRLSPRLLVRRAQAEGLTALALTDHDTTSGLEEAMAEARLVGIRLVPGVEIEVDFSPGEFHLLGLGLEDWSGPFQGILGRLSQARHERNKALYERFRDAGFPGQWEDLEDLAGGGQMGRPHFARWLIASGRVKSVKEAFDTLLGPGQPFYQRKAGLPLTEALEAIHNAGGRAFVAHPSTLYLSLNKLPPLFRSWKDQGLDGVEAWHSGLPTRWSRRLETTANDLGLRVTAGSDFHGDERKDRRLGWVSSTQAIGEEFLERALGNEIKMI